MKNKIAKKLFFSAVALGASVLTLTTTTYAWYVQNNTVTATKITGATKSNDAGSLFITKDGSVATPTWGPKIEFASTDFENSTVGNEKGDLTPLKLLNTNKAVDSFSDVAGVKTVTTGTDPNTTTVSIAKGKVITVNFWLMSSKPNVRIQPTLILKNTTGDEGGATKVSQTAYSAVKAKKMSTGENPQEIVSDTNLVEQDATFWVDAAQALRMSVVTTQGTTESPLHVYDVMSIAKNPKAANATEYTAYTIKTGSIDEKQLGIDDIVVGTDHHELKGAHAFYYRFVGAEPVASFNPANDVNVETVWDQFNLGTTKTKFTFNFWLEGTDIACFDSCASQSFEIGFDFTVVQNS